MNDYNLIIPAMGEGIYEVKIIRWLKNEGDFIKKNDIILEIATDKVDSEIQSPINGILKKKLYNINDLVSIGKTIAIISIINNNNKLIYYDENEYNNLYDKNIKNFYSPLILFLAKKYNIKKHELKNIYRSGKYQRLTKDDFFLYIKKINNQKLINKDHEIIQMNNMRKIISNHMINSKNTAVHVTSFIETDVTNIVLWKNKTKDIFKKKIGFKLSFMPIFIEALIKAIKDFPMINISIKNDIIIKKKYINIGIAIALNNGNLIVPVIKNADLYDFITLSKVINDLIERARLNKLKLNEIQDGTYTITNIGTFGNILGTPIINQPQVAIIAMGFIQKKPSVIETSLGDIIGIRYKMYISHSYDHRIIDGALGGLFVKSVGQYLENFNPKNYKI